MKKLLYALLFFPLTAAAQNIYTIAGGGTGAVADHVPATSVGFGNLRGIAMDNAGNLYIRDYQNCKIFKVSPAIGGTLTRVTGSGSSGYDGDGLPAAYGTIGSGTGIAIDQRNNNIYFTESFRIRKINGAGILSTIAGTGVGGYNGDGIPATAAQIKMNVGCGIVVDDTGSLFFVDNLNRRIRKIDTFGIISTIAGTGVAGFTPDGAMMDTGRLEINTDIALDKYGNIYFNDNYRIRRIDVVTNVITTIAGTGINGSDGDGGPAVLAAIGSDTSPYVDTGGNIYFTDFTHNRVRKISPDGTISTIAGTGVGGYGGDYGPATLALLKFPTGILVTPDGDVICSEAGNGDVRIITDKPLTVPADNEEQELLMITPNPAADVINVTLRTATEQAVHIEIRDMSGRLVSYCEDISNKPIHLSPRLACGTYVLSARAGSDFYSRQIVIQ
jgi:hypothetical protein